MDPVSTVQSVVATRMGQLVELLPFGYAFGAGMMSAVNPCGFALLPAYLALFVGVRREGFYQQPFWRRAGRALAVSAVVTTGFIVLFGAVGALVGFGARPVVRAMPWLGTLMGLVMVGVGIWMLRGRAVSSQLLQGVGAMLGGGQGLRGFFLYGIGYAVCSVSCTLPVFLVVVGTAATAASAAGAFAQFVSYGLGMGSVVLASTLTLASLEEGMSLGCARRAAAYLQPAAGILILLAGTYILYYWLIKGGLIV